MSKHIKITVVSVVLFVSLFVGCAKMGSNPKDVLSKYLDAIYHNKSEEAYQYISEKDKAVKSLQQYLPDKDTPAFAQSLASKISYEIKEIKVIGDKAKAEVAITAPDFGSMFTDVMGVAFMSAFGGEESEKETGKILTDKYKDKEMPMITETQIFDLVKEGDGWKVFLDWETEEKVRATMEEAKQLEKEKKLYDAKEKYQQVLELESKSVESHSKAEASRKVGELDKEITSFKEKQDYISKVRLYAFEAGYHKTYLDDKVAGVSFKIENGGNKTLTKVKVTVYFKDAAHRIIAEEDYHPVLLSDYSFTDSKPLKPNYIWQMEEGKFYKAESVPSEWQEGNAFAKITDIEFEK